MQRVKPRRPPEAGQNHSDEFDARVSLSARSAAHATRGLIGVDETVATARRQTWTAAITRVYSCLQSMSTLTGYGRQSMLQPLASDTHGACRVIIDPNTPTHIAYNTQKGGTDADASYRARRRSLRAGRGRVRPLYEARGV